MKNCDYNTPRIKPACREVDGLTVIVIPAQLGGSGEGELYAPKTGEHKNAIVKYLADGLVYVYGKDGNYALIADSDAVEHPIDVALDSNSYNAVTNHAITTAIANTIETLTAQLEEKAQTLDNNILEERSAREMADGSLQNSISDEAAARNAADSILQSNIDAEIAARETSDITLQDNIDTEASTRAAEDIAIRADLANEIAQETADIRQVQEELNRDFVNDLEMETNAQSVTFIEDKVNPYTGRVSQERDTIPTASATTAGTMSAAEFISITDSQQRLDALENGAVAISGLSENPTQEELTTTWLNATQREGLINRAGIYDVDNTKSWTYYTNVSMWEAVTAGGVTVNQFTNTIAGTIQGSTIAGNVSANADGTGSVAGWVELNNTVASKASTSDLAKVATSGNYSDLNGTPVLATVATSGSYNDLSNKPTISTVNNGTLTIQSNGTNVGTFTANQSSNSTANIPAATTAAYGVTELSTSTTSTSTSLAATPSAVRTAYQHGAWYATCGTSAATVAKVGTCANFSAAGALVTGAHITVKFTYANTATSPTLNVNSTGAKPIYVNGAAATSGAWAAGDIKEFVYDGTNWCMTGGTKVTSQNIDWATLDDTGWVLLNSERNCYYRRIQNIVWVTANWTTADATVNGTTTFGTLPTDCRPSRTIIFALSDYQGTSSAGCKGFIQTTGAVQLYSRSETRYGGFTVSFPID